MKKIVLSVLMSICSFLGFSQSENNNIDSKFKFGFNIGNNYSILQSQESLPNGAEINNGVGFKVGVIMDYSFSKNFLISPKTELSFNNSKIEHVNNNNSINTYNVFPTTFEIMTHFVYKIGKGKNHPYLLLGPNYRFPLKTDSKTSNELETNLGLAIDFGIGLEHKFKYFFFAPELRYSRGLNNINKNQTLPLLNYHNISLVFNLK